MVPKKLPEQCKLFISQSMQHSTEEKVNKERQQVIDCLNYLYPCTKFILCEQYYVEEPESWKSKSPRALRWARLGRSLEIMGDADLIVFVDEGITGNIAPGCLVELQTCKGYESEYSYQYTTLNELTNAKYHREKQHTTDLEYLINYCVGSDTKKYTEYFNELMDIVKTIVPMIDHDSFIVNDNRDEWFIEYQADTLSIYAGLNKSVVIDEPDYEYGRFFLFSIEEIHEDKPNSRIDVRSIYTTEHQGLYIDNCQYDKTDIHYELFETLDNYIGLHVSDIKELN